MLEFKVNEYLTLKLEGDKTNIYISGQLFIQCKYLLIHIPYSDIHNYDQVESIDEAIEDYNAQEGPHDTKRYIEPEVEFWGHCSNIQTWYENNYDTRLLHTNLSFPLLKALADAGDPKAEHALKEEIINRLSSRHLPVITYLINENYLKYLTREEIETFAWDILNRDPSLEHIHPSLLQKFVDMGISKARVLLKQEIIEYLSSNNMTEISYILDNMYYEYLTQEELNQFIKDFLDRKIPLPSIPKLITQGIITQISKKHYQYILEQFPHIKKEGKIYFLDIDTIEFWDTDTIQNSISQQWLSNFDDFDGDKFDLIWRTLNALLEYDENNKKYSKKVILVGEDQRFIECERLLVIIGETLAAAEILAAFDGFDYEILSDFDEILDWIEKNRSFLPDTYITTAIEVVSKIYDNDLPTQFFMFSDPEENEEWLENLHDLISRLK
ncbi:MAG: hypothetical protein ACFFG0_10155 [Candidatus Thorarchaeota archaeon]